MKSDMSLNPKEPNHILYSKGKLIKSAEPDIETALSKLAKLTRHTSDQVKERLLSGKQKKIKSSSSLKKLILLQEKFTNCGLNSYIQLDLKNS